MKIELTKELKELIDNSVKKGITLSKINQELLNSEFLDTDILSKYKTASDESKKTITKVRDYINIHQKDI